MTPVPEERVPSDWAMAKARAFVDHCWHEAGKLEPSDVASLLDAARAEGEATARARVAALERIQDHREYLLNQLARIIDSIGCAMDFGGKPWEEAGPLFLQAAVDRIGELKREAAAARRAALQDCLDELRSIPTGTSGAEAMRYEAIQRIRALAQPPAAGAGQAAPELGKAGPS